MTGPPRRGSWVFWVGNTDNYEKERNWGTSAVRPSSRREGEPIQHRSGEATRSGRCEPDETGTGAASVCRLGMTAVPTPTSRNAGPLGWIAMSLTIAAAGLAAPAGRALAASESRRTAIVEAVERVHQSVVSLSSEKKAESHSRWPFSAEENQRPRVSGMGSGVIIDRRGYILTNHH